MIKCNKFSSVTLTASGTQKLHTQPVRPGNRQETEAVEKNANVCTHDIQKSWHMVTDGTYWNDVWRATQCTGEEEDCGLSYNCIDCKKNVLGET